MLEKLAKQTAIYGISTILGRFLSYLLTPFYTRIFGLDSYGIITDVYALIPFALVVLTLGMESSYFRFAAKTETEGGDIAVAKQRIFATAWGITSIAAIIFFTIVLIFHTSISTFMGEVYSLHTEYVIIVAAIVLFDVAGCIPFSRLREQGRAGTFVMLKLANIIMQVLFAVLFWRIGLFESAFGVGWAFIANLIASVCTTIAVIIATGAIKPHIDKTILAMLLVYSLPLLLSGIAGTANEFIDRQMIKYLVPENAMAQLGIYGAITKIAVVMTLFTQMYRLAAEPFFLANFKKEDFIAMNAAALKYYVLFSIAIFLCIALYRNIFALIVGSKFREGIFILPIVLGANILSGMWLNLSFWYKREEKTGFALLITLSGLIFSIIGGIILIPKAGYFGAAWSRFIAEAVMVGVSIALNRKFFPTPYDFKRITEYAVVGLTIFAVSEIFIQPQHPFMQYLVNTVLFISYLIYAIYRENIDIVAMVRTIIKRS